MKYLNRFFSLVVIGLTLTACSKEKQLERTLYKKDGKWKVQSAEWSQVSQSSSSGQSVVTGTSTDAGTFEFKDDGNGSYDFTLGTETYSQSFDWTVSEENFSIIKVAQSFDFFTGDIVQMAISFSGTRVDKNKLEIEGSETFQYYSGDIDQRVMSGTFTLVRE